MKKHLVNKDLPIGNFRIVCTKCGKVYAQDHGNLTQGAVNAMKYPDICNECDGEIILETNPE